MFKTIIYFSLFFIVADSVCGFSPLMGFKKKIRTLPVPGTAKEPVLVPTKDYSDSPKHPVIVDDKTGKEVPGSSFKKLAPVANNNDETKAIEGLEEPEMFEESRMIEASKIIEEARMMEKPGMIEESLMEESKVMEESKPMEDRILGGMTALPGMFPYMASLRTSDMYHVCGAAILNSYWLITAAHCGNKYVYAVVGTTSLTSGGSTYTVNQIKTYGFNGTNFANDIALVQVSKPIQFSFGKIQSIPLNDYDLSDNTVMIFSGWGYINNNGPPSNNLQYIYLKQMSIYTCANIMVENPQALPIYYSQICTAASKPDQGACRGDSGGPLVYNGKLVGIDSWGPKPCGTYPDVFTKVKWYYNWIQSTIAP